MDRSAGTSLTSVVVTATTVLPTLASVLAATATLPDHTEDASRVEESVLSSSGFVSGSVAAADSGSTLISDPAHVEL